MSPTPAENAKDIKALETKVNDYKDGHAELHRDIAASMATIEATMVTVNATVQDISKTQQDLVPIVEIIKQDIPQIKADQRANNKFRWKGAVVVGIVAVLFTALVGAGVSFMFNKLRNENFITKDDIADIYKFSDSLKPGIAEAAMCEESPNKEKCEAEVKENNGG